mmetsp:Transcript_64640/g.168086  ORF Transcript_64640/g.168086 Transcript_64640/m.168086 type:complete len:229 (-) Transcript_64640:1329-2015(-)
MPPSSFLRRSKSTSNWLSSTIRSRHTVRGITNSGQTSYIVLERILFVYWHMRSSSNQALCLSMSALKSRSLMPWTCGLAVLGRLAFGDSVAVMIFGRGVDAAVLSVRAVKPASSSQVADHKSTSRQWPNIVRGAGLPLLNVPKSPLKSKRNFMEVSPELSMDLSYCLELADKYASTSPAAAFDAKLSAAGPCGSGARTGCTNRRRLVVPAPVPSSVTFSGGVDKVRKL